MKKVLKMVTITAASLGTLVAFASPAFADQIITSPNWENNNNQINYFNVKGQGYWVDSNTLLELWGTESGGTYTDKQEDLSIDVAEGGQPISFGKLITKDVDYYSGNTFLYSDTPSAQGGPYLTTQGHVVVGHSSNTNVGFGPLPTYAQGHTSYSVTYAIPNSANPTVTVNI